MPIVPYIGEISTPSTLYYIIFNFHFRNGRAWDFSPEFGLVIAGGRESVSCPCWDRVEISEDFGDSFTELKELPVELTYACLVIADETIFVAGGQRRRNTNL